MAVAAMPLGRLLIVDVDAHVRSACSNLLSASGFEITQTGDPAEAVRRAKRWSRRCF